MTKENKTEGEDAPAHAKDTVLRFYEMAEENGFPSPADMVLRIIPIFQGLNIPPSMATMYLGYLAGLAATGAASGSQEKADFLAMGAGGLARATAIFSVNCEAEIENAMRVARGEKAQ